MFQSLLNVIYAKLKLFFLFISLNDKSVII